jgi:hypothetical protein
MDLLGVGMPFWERRVAETYTPLCDCHGDRMLYGTDVCCADSMMFVAFLALTTSYDYDMIWRLTSFVLFTVLCSSINT